VLQLALYKINLMPLGHSLQAFSFIHGLQLFHLVDIKQIPLGSPQNWVVEDHFCLHSYQSRGTYIFLKNFHLRNEVLISDLK
jgi:hypothetical protein